MPKRGRSRSFEWGRARRPRVSNKLGVPHRSEGSDGDIQIRQTNLGTKLFGKLGGRWSSAFLSSEEEVIGTKGTKIGMNSSGDFTVNQILLNGKISLTSIGSQNVCIGVDNSDSGGRNICIGAEAGKSLDEGVQNILIGTGAGKNIEGGSSEGENNVCIGNAAGDAITDGIRNILIGTNAGSSIVDGDSNVCIGNAAGLSITDGINNVCIGLSATLLNNVSYSTAIDGQATGDNAVALGWNASAGETAIAIGTNITNATADTVMFGDTDASVKSADWSSAGAIAWTGTSDVRKKRNIEDSKLGLEFINKLRPRTFQWKPQNEVPKEWQHYSEENAWDIEKIHHGFIAQEVKEVLDEYNAPDSVAGWNQDDDGMQRLGETKLITPLIKAVQELSAKVDAMQIEINNLK